MQGPEPRTLKVSDLGYEHMLHLMHFKCAENTLQI